MDDGNLDKTNNLKEPLQEMEGLMTRAKTKRFKEVLQDLVMEVQAKEDPTKFEYNTKFVTCLQLEDNISPI